MRQEEALRNALKHVLPLMRREAEATEPPNLNLHLEGMTEEEYEEEWGLNAELYAEWMMAIQIVEDALDATETPEMEQLREWLSGDHEGIYLNVSDLLNHIREEHGYGATESETVDHSPVA